MIARNGKPVVRLVPIPKRASLTSVHGVWKGRVLIADDFDELPDEIDEAFGAR